MNTMNYLFINTTLVNVVDPLAINICLTRLWNLCKDSSSTLKND